MTAEKTEGLSYVEAMKVYVRTEETGERVVDSDHMEYWIENDCPHAKWSGAEDILRLCPELKDAPFRIIKPAPKPVTLEDCLRAKRVKVTPPEGIKLSVEILNQLDGEWCTDEVGHIYAAVANGWQVEILEE